MHIDKNTPATAHQEISVAAGREVSWDLLTTMDQSAGWNPDVKTAAQPAIEERAVFRWKAGAVSLTSTMQEVERPRTLGWTGTSIGVHALSGALPRLLPGMTRRSLQKTLDSWSRHLEAEAEMRAGA